VSELLNFPAAIGFLYRRERDAGSKFRCDINGPRSYFPKDINGAGGKPESILAWPALSEFFGSCMLFTPPPHQGRHAMRLRAVPSAAQTVPQRVGATGDNHRDVPP
jgi:hypothetical protein